MATRTTTTRTTSCAPAPSADRGPLSFAELVEAYLDCRRTKRNSNAALSVLDAITEPGLPLSWLRSARASAAETGATVGWAWISPTGDVSRFTADFDGKHDQLVQGWKVRPVAFCDSIANETVAEGADALAHEVWSAAQRAPGEGIEDAVQRIAAILSRSPAMAAEVADWRELTRRLYVELFHCDQQMGSTRDENGEPHWTQSAVVRDVLADAKAALNDAPQPTQADAPAETRALPMMCNAFRVTEVSGDPDPAEQRFYMRFSFPSIEALHAADDEWRKFIAPAQADARVGLTDEQILALNAGEVFFSESPTKYPEAGHGTQYHAGAPGVLGFARAAIALAAHPGQSEPRAEVTNPFRELLAALIDIYDDECNNAPEDRCYVEGAWSEVLGEARALLAPLPDPAQVAAESPDWVKNALPPEGA